MGKQGAEAGRALLAGEVAEAVPPARGWSRLCGSDMRKPSVTAQLEGPTACIQLHRTGCALPPSTSVVAVTDSDGDAFLHHSGCCFVPELAPTGEPCQLPLNGLRLISVRQAMRVVRNPCLSDLSCSQLCSWLCPEPGWDTRLLERRYKTGGGQPRLGLTNPAGIQTQMQL